MSFVKHEPLFFKGEKLRHTHNSRMLIPSLLFAIAISFIGISSAPLPPGLISYLTISSAVVTGIPAPAVKVFDTGATTVEFDALIQAIANVTLYETDLAKNLVDFDNIEAMVNDRFATPGRRGPVPHLVLLCASANMMRMCRDIRKRGSLFIVKLKKELAIAELAMMESIRQAIVASPSLD
jgi:hypothetical protein